MRIGEIFISPILKLFRHVIKRNLHFSYVIEDGLFGKYLFITPQKSKSKNLHRNFCFQIGGF